MSVSHMASHVLAAAPAVASGGVAGVAGGAVVIMGAYAWYEVKHKGWDWPPLLFGIGLASVLHGNPIVSGIGTAIASIFQGIFTGLSSML